MLRRSNLTFVLLFAASLWAADTPVRSQPELVARPDGQAWLAILDNGFSIRHYHREASGTHTRLYVSAKGDSFVDVPASSIVEIQPDNIEITSPGAQEGVPLASFDLEEVVATASDRYGIDADLIRSVIAAESGFNPGAVSPKGAQGLMQLMPETASSLGVEDALNPERNVDGGTRYLRELLVLYKGDVVKALAAYNAGPQRVDRYNGVPPYSETQAYVRRVIREFNRKKSGHKAANTGDN